MSELIRTNRLEIYESADQDVDIIIEIESHPENRDFLWIGTPEEHRDEIRDPNHLLLLFRDNDTETGKGYGRESMEGLIKYAFEETETNRLWLDVYPDNPVGIRLYESLGMHKDGVLRQNYKAERGYLDQIIYSMLRSEY